MTEKKHRHVALLLSIYNYRIHLGIVKYAKEAGWIIDSMMSGYRKLPKYWNGDGIISHHLGHDKIIQAINEKSLPTVDLGFYSKKIELPMVYIDNKGIAEMAGKYLLDIGFKNVGYILRAPGFSHSDKYRYDFLREFILGKKKNFYTLHSGTFIEDLKELPKPIALMGENDWITSDYVRRCYDAGYKTPYEVAFIGVENDPLFCDVAQVSLSSVDNNLELRGYTAAKILDNMMNGGPPPEAPILIPPKNVVERESTNIIPIPHLPTSRALKYIRENYKDKGLSVDKIAKFSGMCRRRLEDNFKKYVGHSIPKEIKRIRLADAKKLLNESKMKIYEIADECGFSSPKHMAKIFKAEFGIMPKEFRKTHFSEKSPF